MFLRIQKVWQMPIFVKKNLLKKDDVFTQHKQEISSFIV